MATNKPGKSDTVEELLRDLNNLIRDQMIIQLGLAGVPQRQIREIVGVDITRVNRLVKPLKKSGS